MGWTATVGGDSVTPLDGSVRISNQMSARSTASFSLWSDTGAVPALGAEVVLFWDGTRLYGGTIDEASAEYEGPAIGATIQVTCTDYSHALDRRIPGEYSWQGQLAGTIATDICTNGLTDEGVGLTDVEDGPTIERFEITYDSDETVRSALNRLAELAGMKVWMDETNGLHLAATPVTPDCPWAAVEPTYNAATLRVWETREDYANRLLLRLGQYLLPEDGQIFTGDGERRVFVLDHPCMAEPTITVNTVAQTVGIGGVDTGKNWYWNSGSRDITQDDGDPVLVDESLAVLYVGSDQRVIDSQNDGEITARAAIEGNSGIYEKSIFTDVPMTEEQAQAYADAWVAAHSVMPHYAEITSNSLLESDLKLTKVGQVISVERATCSVDLELLITKIDFSDTDNLVLNASITAVSGFPALDAVGYFKGLGGGGGGGAATGVGVSAVSTSVTIGYE